MRIAALAFSAVLLSGCSWLGLGGQKHHTQGAHGQYVQQGRYMSPQGQGAQYAAQRQFAHQARRGPCEITAVTQPVPRGCAPEQVTIALPQNPNAFAGGQYGQPSYGAQTPDAASYGRAAYDAQRNAGLHTTVGHKAWTRPRFRVNGSLGFETNVSGDVFNPSDLPGLYDPLTHRESRLEGTPSDGQVTEYFYEPRIENVNGAIAESPTVSVSDLYAAPFTIGAGAEYQITDRFAAFGGASYTVARGSSAGGITYDADVHRYGSTQNFIELPASPGTFVAAGAPTLLNTSFPDVDVAKVTISANDLQRTNLELGGRYYFKDAFPKHLERPLTPYISAAAGAAHYNELEVSGGAEELLLTQYFESAAAGGDLTLAYSNERTSSAQTVLEKGWVPTGSITLGAEWQVTPKAALAFETGVRYEGARERADGTDTEGFVAIPLTLRGSIGF